MREALNQSKPMSRKRVGSTLFPPAAKGASYTMRMVRQAATAVEKTKRFTAVVVSLSTCTKATVTRTNAARIKTTRLGDGGGGASTPER